MSRIGGSSEYVSRGAVYYHALGTWASRSANNAPTANVGHNGTLTLSSRSLAAFCMACALGCEQ